MLIYDLNVMIYFKKALKKSFYLQKTKEVAKNLLGKLLVRKFESDYLAGEIVETEAYTPEGDEANHSARGKTKRNAAMHEEGGILYVYKIYGVHHCINFVTEHKNKGAAVLIRALRPTLGIEEMQKNRGESNIFKLCKGPGNTAKAFGFTIENNFDNLYTENLFVQDYKNYDESAIIADKRIGISKSIELPYRFYLKNNKYVSGKKIA